MTQNQHTATKLVKAVSVMLGNNLVQIDTFQSEDAELNLKFQSPSLPEHRNWKDIQVGKSSRKKKKTSPNVDWNPFPPNFFFSLDLDRIMKCYAWRPMKKVRQLYRALQLDAEEESQFPISPFQSSRLLPSWCPTPSALGEGCTIQNPRMSMDADLLDQEWRTIRKYLTKMNKEH